MLKKKYIILIDVLIIILFLILYIFYFGGKYLKKLNTFIYENNNIIIKNELNEFINTINDINYKDIYTFRYNNKNEIIGAEYNTSYINRNLVAYTNKFKNKVQDNLYNKYLNKYFKRVNLNGTYLIVPLGILYDNPFLFNFGPELFLSYDYLHTYNFYLDFDAKNYGLNNILVNLYLVVDVNQSIFKPVLTTTNKNSYRFLLSSQIVYGRVSDFLNSGINMKSKDLWYNYVGDNMKTIKINNTTYEVINDDFDSIDIDLLTEKITEYFDGFDYIVGDYAYNKLRLKGFNDKKNKYYKPINDIANLNNYISEYCAYGCKWFCIKKTSNKDWFKIILLI